MDAWIARMEASDFVIGTTLHGTVASLLAGTPAMLIAHDSRTSEEAEFASIPAATSTEVAPMDRDMLEGLYARVSVSRFNRRYRKNYKTYKSLLERNRLAHDLE